MFKMVLSEIRIECNRLKLGFELFQMLQDVEARLSAVLVAEYTPQHTGDILKSINVYRSDQNTILGSAGKIFIGSFEQALVIPRRWRSGRRHARQQRKQQQQQQTNKPRHIVNKPIQ